MNASAQGSVVVKRLRNGDTVFLSLVPDKPLYQALISDSNTPKPDWSVAENRPTITPTFRSARGNSVTTLKHTWLYNGIDVTDSSVKSKFSLNGTTGALTIIGNLADEDNIASDTLTYTGIISVAGVESTLTKDITVLIQPSGSNAYTGYIYSDSLQLTKDEDEITLKTMLYLAGGPVTDYYVDWYKDTDEFKTNVSGSDTLTVGCDDVDGEQIFIARFKLQRTDTTYVASHAVRVQDTDDEYFVKLTTSGGEVSAGNSVKVTATLYRIPASGGNEELYEPTGATWVMRIRDGNTWDEIAKASGNTITVSTTHTDYTGTDGTAKVRDVEVEAEVSWTE